MMDAETLYRLALKVLTVKEATRILVDMDQVLVELANAQANPNRKWSERLTDWCRRHDLPNESLDRLKEGLRRKVDEANQRKERELAKDAYVRFGKTLKGLGEAIVQHASTFGPDYACDWLRKSNLPALMEQLPKLPTPSELKAVS